MLADDPRPDLGMLLHDLPLRCIEFARLAQDRIGNADLAHIMHRRGMQQLFSPRLAEAGRAGQYLGIVAHTNDVQPRFVVLVLGSQAQTLDDLQTGLQQFFNAHQ